MKQLRYMVVVVGVVLLLCAGGWLALRATFEAGDRRDEARLRAAIVEDATQAAGVLAQTLRAMGERSPDASVAELMARRGDAPPHEWEELPDGGVRVQVWAGVTLSSGIGLPVGEQAAGCFELHRAGERWSAVEAECTRTGTPADTYHLHPPWFTFDPLTGEPVAGAR